MGTGELNAGGNPTMDHNPIQGEVEILLVASSGLVGHLVRKQTLPLINNKPQRTGMQG